MYLLDTNVVSEIRKARPHGGVVAWMKVQELSSLFIPAVVIGELQAGVEMVRVQDSEKVQQLDTWIDGIVQNFTILSFDAPCARAWSRLQHKQQIHLSQDAMIAATAKIHALTVVTRNLRDFDAMGVPIYNPFEFRNL